VWNEDFRRRRIRGRKEKRNNRDNAESHVIEHYGREALKLHRPYHTRSHFTVPYHFSSYLHQHIPLLYHMAVVLM